MIGSLLTSCRWSLASLAASWCGSFMNLAGCSAGSRLAERRSCSRSWSARARRLRLERAAGMKFGLARLFGVDVGLASWCGWPQVRQWGIRFSSWLDLAPSRRSCKWQSGSRTLSSWGCSQTCSSLHQLNSRPFPFRFEHTIFGLVISRQLSSSCRSSSLAIP